MITNKDIFEIDPYKAVNVIGRWFLTFKNDKTIKEARNILEKFLSQFPKNKRKELLNSLKHIKYVKTTKKAF